MTNLLKKFYCYQSQCIIIDKKYMTNQLKNDCIDYITNNKDYLLYYIEDDFDPHYIITHINFLNN